MKIVFALLAVCAVGWPATLTWTDNNPPGTTYSVLRATGTCAASQAADFAAVASKLAVKTYVDVPAPGQYCYQIAAAFGTMPDARSNKIDWTQPLTAPVLTITASVIVAPWVGVVRDGAGGAWPAWIAGLTRDCRTCELSTSRRITWDVNGEQRSADVTALANHPTIIETIPRCEGCPNLPAATCLQQDVLYPTYPRDCRKG